MAEYKAVIADGLTAVPHVAEIQRVFQSAPTDHFITHFGFSSKPVTWNTEVFFGGKYVLTYQVDVTIDYTASKIRDIVGQPKFYLVEISELARLADGRITGSMAPGHILGITEWQKVFRAGGNFSVIGIALDTNSPLPLFQEYIASQRKHRVQVTSDGAIEQRTTP